jgi:hypothetical protein
MKGEPAPALGYLREGCMNKKRMFWFSLAFVALMALSTVLGGCATLPSSLYETYSLKYGELGFSFEYPTYYRLVGKDTAREPDWVKVLFARTRLVRGLTDNFFEVSTGSPPLNELLSGEKDLVVLERYSTTVAGVPAEFVAFSSTGFSNTTTVTRAVFFEVNVWLWQVALRSEEAGADQGKLDFEHIIETFKVLPD